jgi:hypothetical protein
MLISPAAAHAMQCASMLSKGEPKLEDGTLWKRPEPSKNFEQSFSQVNVSQHTFSLYYNN